MENERSSTTAIVVSPVVFAQGATGSAPQGHCGTEFAGVFALPFKAHWGGVTLPEGEYTLCFGIHGLGIYFVRIFGRAKGSPQGIVLIERHDAASASRNALICIREGDAYIVRGLEMTAIGKSVRFALPGGEMRTANKAIVRTKSHLATRWKNMP